MATDTYVNLEINVEPLDELDQFALLACQVYNFGNTTDWFGNFRGGLYGFYSRIYGVKNHYSQVHSWLPKPRLPVEIEWHVASIFFGMDSAIECFVFMLNALGDGTTPKSFRDITDATALRRVAPNDVLGNPAASRPTPPLSGYGMVFPSLQSHWQSHQSLIRTIMEQHDASKHRYTTYRGGMMRKDDPPPGFFEYFGARNDPTKRMLLTPHAEIIVTRDPKQPKSDRTPTAYEDRVVMEAIVAEFCDFIRQSCVLAVDDAKAKINLHYKDFQRT